ncbi:uncharacterized protein LOC124255551 isoform X2 [Haliotis rubra]|uniref:uncharacterized protein LOC124255551 isoform X2 n=1 Tax=Haliotis rubra TaxID=36100 RepID=UPI001EE5AAC2|nr:uncharacterized protein LOC124255551 isoform X2 [Haliotis rubra]
MEQREVKPNEDENSVSASGKDKSTFQPDLSDINQNYVSNTCKSIVNFQRSQNEVISQMSQLPEHNDEPILSGGGDPITSNQQGDSVIESSSCTDTSESNQRSQFLRVEQERMTAVSGTPTNTCPPCSGMMQSSSDVMSDGVLNVPNLSLLEDSDDEEEWESSDIELVEGNEDTFVKGDYGSDDGELIARGASRDTRPAFSVPSVVNSGSALRLNRELSRITQPGDDLTIGSTAPTECFTTDLQEDGAPLARPPLKCHHDVRQGSRKELEEFVRKHMYKAPPNKGLLVNEELNPVNIGSEWFYREKEEYRILDGIQHNSVCLCEDHKSHHKFVRKRRKRVKFEGQKKSVLVPLLHHDSPYIMDIFGLIVFTEEVHVFMEYCEAENICFRIPSDLTSLCLIDFEFVRTQESPPQFKGYTTQFLPPWWETIKKEELFSPLLVTMDLWAVACVAICLLTSKRPWSKQVKDFKKQCPECPAKSCNCNRVLRQVMNHISTDGHNILKILDKNVLVKTKEGQLLKTLEFLTQRDQGDKDCSRAEQAQKILSGEDAEVETVEIEIQYKGRLLYKTVVDKGTSVGQVLQKQEVQRKLNDKLTLAQPPSDHAINSRCIITVQKGDSRVKKWMEKLHLL